MNRLGWVRGVLVAVTLAPVSQARALADAGPCNASGCPTGCCDSNGMCQPGNIDAACGTGGVVCANCPHLWFCSLAQACAPDCGLSACNGCCVAQTACVNGFNQSDSECGVGGNTCGPCPTGTMCVQNTGLGGGTCQFSDGGVVVVDGGLPTDAGAPSDGGSSSDGGTSTDAGAFMDSGTSGGDGGTVRSGAPRGELGCGCSGSGAMVGLALLGLVMSFARRRRS